MIQPFGGEHDRVLLGAEAQAAGIAAVTPVRTVASSGLFLALGVSHGVSVVRLTSRKPNGGPLD